MHEFSNYSFFTQGYRADPFNIVNNEAWAKGKKSFLYFTDILIDFVESKEIIDSYDWRKNIINWFILFAIMGLTIFLLFTETTLTYQINAIVGNEIKSKLQVLLLVTMIASNILWHKNWRDFLAITTTMLGAWLGLHL